MTVWDEMRMLEWFGKLEVELIGADDLGGTVLELIDAELRFHNFFPLPFNLRSEI